MKQETYQDFEPGYTAVGNAFMFNWVFHYNPFTEIWNAIPREFYNIYWNEDSHPAILKSKNISDLKDLLYRTNGDSEEIKKLLESNG